MPGKDGTGPDGCGPKRQNPGVPGQAPGSQVPRGQGRGRGKGRGKGCGNQGQFCPWRDPRDEPAAPTDPAPSDGAAEDPNAKP